jgi:glycosyltransferase involved in cell wall biosynthesis
MTLSGQDITVLIPTRDRRELVLNAIKTVLAQTVAPAEILVVDDGSNDGTAEAIAALAPTAAQIRVIPGPAKGVGPARNHGLKACKTPLVCFLDSDDELRPEALEVALNAWKASDTMLIFSAEQFPEDPRLLTKKTPQNQFSLSGLLGDDSDFNPPWGLARVDHLQAIGAFTDELPCAVDYDLLLRLCAEDRTVRCLRTPVYRYRRDPNAETVSSNQVRNYLARLHALSRLEDNYPELVRSHQVCFNQIRVRFLLRFCAAQQATRCALSPAEKSDLRTRAREALRLQPLRLRVAINYLKCMLTP